MGMFDEVICSVTLPGDPPSFTRAPDYRFQTKDLECVMALYEITEDGYLKQIGGGTWSGDAFAPEIVDYHGALRFYNSNCTASAFGVRFTPDGADYDHVEYRATFINGQLSEIVETEREKEPALARNLLEEIDAKFNVSEPEVSTEEPEIGQSMFLQFGGGIKGYSVTVIAKTEREIIVTNDKGRAELVDRNFLGHLLFHSEDDSKKLNGWRDETRKAKMAYAQELMTLEREVEP